MRFILILLFGCVVSSALAAGFSLAYFETVVWDICQPLFFMAAAATIQGTIALSLFLNLIFSIRKNASK